MLVEMILLMYKGTAAFAIRNLKMSLNSTMVFLWYEISGKVWI